MQRWTARSKSPEWVWESLKNKAEKNNSWAKDTGSPVSMCQNLGSVIRSSKQLANEVLIMS